MSEPVVIVGLGAEGLKGLGPGALDAIRGATFIAGGRRHLRFLGPTRAETFPITDQVEPLLRRLANRRPDERCVVLASGDPLFYGIGHTISETLGREQVRVEPTISSMQLAFARTGLSWQEASIGSVHGRELAAGLLPLLGRRRIGVFTRDGESPSEIAQFFVDRGLNDYDSWVCENLGTSEETVISGSIETLIGRRFSTLNVLVLARRKRGESKESTNPSSRLEMSDDGFAQPESGPILLTNPDVRSLVARRFRGLRSGPVWDIGAGLGGVAVELARAYPNSEIVAVERSPRELEFLKTNRLRFEVYNLRVREGEAPGCLREEPPPAGVFLGGSGGQLDEILDLVIERLLPGGRFVGNFVGLENLVRVLERLKTTGWPVALHEVQISDGRPLGGLTTFVPQRPVWMVRSDHPED
ncbi:MAG: bifunctional cobalt-precorrin-7 (C(5))-methyltransferase/cobalt-precorrin-6B (C(15))-methyltransferase [Isosphaeraceae bacterium]